MLEDKSAAPREIRLDFTVPTGWNVDYREGATTIIGPEGDLRITFVEATPGATVQETAISAWRRIDEGFDSKVRLEVETPPMSGWDGGHQIVYEVPPSESRSEVAILRKLGTRVFVNLMRGTAAAFSRRGAQVAEAVTSWKPSGFTEVNLKDKPASAWTDEHTAKLREFVHSAMTAMHVPGVAIAIVQSGKIVFAAGFGTRVAGEESPVTPATRFMIGSTTKSLTTLLMARLIDQQKIRWDTPVCDLLPDFALADPQLTQRLTLAHSVSASTGMPRQDSEMIFRYSGFTAEDRIAQMKTMRPTTGFGETFQYSNLLVSAGGYAAARAFMAEGSLMEAYERAFSELILRPLGMRDTFLRQEDALNGDAALPHALNFEGGVSRIPLHIEKFAFSVAPAGAAWSTVEDMAQYLLLELGAGRMPGGTRLVSEEALLERRKKGIRIDEKTSYGLGLLVSDNAGLRVIGHGGATLGFSSDLFFVPERDLGVVALTNLQGAAVFLGALGQKVFELAFGAEAKAEKTIAAAAKIGDQSTALLREKVIIVPAAMDWVDGLVGMYECDELGSATLTRREDGYWMQFEEFGSAVGCEVRPGGDRLLRLISPPWRGGAKLLLDVETGTLLFDQGQSKYQFRRRTTAGA